jgi:multiple sugar transport system substrate-binding protein
VTRRRLIESTAALGAAVLVLPGKAPAATGSKPLAGTTLNVSTWSGPYTRWLPEYLPEFEERTGARVNYESPAFPIYNQRADLELSTQGSSYDVLNVTFVYSSRWIGAGWLTPLDPFIGDPTKTPAGWDADDFLAGASVPMRGSDGQLFGIPWIADTFMAGCSRFDLFEEAGLGLPDSFEEMEPAMKAVSGKEHVAGYVATNHYGWSFVPWLMGFGGKVFRDPPHDLTPMLDAPEAVHASEFFARLLTSYGPDGALSYDDNQLTEALKMGRVNYANTSQAFIVQIGAPDSKVAKTCNFSLFPKGPAGRFPGVASHGWGIPSGSRQKEAAWQFIVWAMSKDLITRIMTEKGYGSVTRRSVVETPEFKKKLTINGVDLAKLYVDTIDLAAGGYMTYRTVSIYPQVDKQLDIAIQNIASQQMSAKEAMTKAQEASLAEIKRAGVKL